MMGNTLLTQEKAPLTRTRASLSVSVMALPPILRVLTVNDTGVNYGA